MVSFLPMDFGQPLNAILGGRTRVAVVRALCEMPAGYAATGREIARRAAINHPLELAVLSDLADHGLVRRARVGRADTYELNRSHVLSETLCSLFRHEAAARSDLLSFLGNQISAHAPSAADAYLFGSVAEDGGTAASDIDIALVWPGASDRQIEQASESISEAVRLRYGNKAQVLVRTTPIPERELRGAWKSVIGHGIRLVSKRSGRERG
ncbi:MAG: hypothetical protein E6I64_06140 [Chloroflexi bacterium]|nr:MAG: hypothetical protein E6I64_06140 [Chloroflexota bacterium]